MIAALSLLLQLTQPAPAAPLPPQDWSTLPVLRLRNPATALANTSTFVQGEVVSGRCGKAVKTSGGWSLTVDLAVLATPDGRIRRITPRAIDCATVEQYAAGIIIGAPRESIDTPGIASDTWYRTSLTFAWGA